MKQMQIPNPWSGAPVYYRRITTSTMEDARRLFSAGCVDGTVVVADFQERGRGRIPERSWIAEAGRNLLFTLVLRSRSGTDGFAAAGAHQRLPLLAGLALALSIEGLYGLSVQLKWPNDLLVEGKKLAGILCEALAEGNNLGVLIGIGLNCNQLRFANQLGLTATSLAHILGREVNPPEILAAVLPTVKSCLADGEWHAKVVQRLYGLNRVAYLVAPPQSITKQGVIRGLNHDGSLLFQPDGHSEAIAVYGGEVRFAAEEF
ncbi:MAG: biotin--[acetyl-CoA-carboxylase] ligase [Spirochaetaceae bacterium]|nr:MAG: biotin--[acetyl-CoA-carboxylase] ligase [Spirochaetaceae bacterium]